MRPPLWQPTEALSSREQTVLRRIRRAKLFVFLRLHRHVILDAAFQEELATLYEERPKGHPPVPPALLALVTILQAYTGDHSSWPRSDRLHCSTARRRRWASQTAPSLTGDASRGRRPPAVPGA